VVAYTLPKLNYESEVELRVTLCGLSEKHDIRQRNRLVSPRCVACRRPGADVGGAGPILAQILEGWVASELTAGPARCCAVRPRLSVRSRADRTCDVCPWEVPSWAVHIPNLACRFFLGSHGIGGVSASSCGSGWSRPASTSLGSVLRVLLSMEYSHPLSSDRGYAASRAVWPRSSSNPCLQRSWSSPSHQRAHSSCLCSLCSSLCMWPMRPVQPPRHHRRRSGRYFERRVSWGAAAVTAPTQTTWFVWSCAALDAALRCIVLYAALHRVVRYVAVRHAPLFAARLEPRASLGLVRQGTPSKDAHSWWS
jgi:hypothetical protein